MECFSFTDKAAEEDEVAAIFMIYTSIWRGVAFHAIQIFSAKWVNIICTPKHFVPHGTQMSWQCSQTATDGSAVTTIVIINNFWCCLFAFLVCFVTATFAKTYRGFKTILGDQQQPFSSSKHQQSGSAAVVFMLRLLYRLPSRMILNIFSMSE